MQHPPAYPGTQPAGGMYPGLPNGQQNYPSYPGGQPSYPAAQSNYPTGPQPGYPQWGNPGFQQSSADGYSGTVVNNGPGYPNNAGGGGGAAGPSAPTCKLILRLTVMKCLKKNRLIDCSSFQFQKKKKQTKAPITMLECWRINKTTVGSLHRRT